MRKKIAVLILGYNHKIFLKDVLESALKQDYSDYDVVYIDNASSDGSVEFVTEHYPSIRIVSNNINTGYAGAYDTELRNVFLQGYDAAVLLNPDTVTATNWLSTLVASAFSDTSIALAQSKILLWTDMPTDRINSFGNNLHFLGFGYCGHYNQKDGIEFNQDKDVTYASGASLLIKKEHYPEKIHFDTDYFAYMEDQDLGWQAQLLGLRSVVSAHSIVWHKYDFQKKGTGNHKQYLLERNRLFFIMKFFELRTIALVFPALIIMDIGIFLHSLSKGYFVQKIKSEVDFLKNIPQTIAKRKALQGSRVLTDKQLFMKLNPGIIFEEVGSPLMRIANMFLSIYYRIIKYLL